MHISNRPLALAAAALATSLAFGSALADEVKVTTEASDEAERASEAATVLTTAVNGEDGSIPEALLEKAHAIAVIPNVMKAAVLVGGKYGKGLVAERMPNGEWGAPAYITVGGGSFGYQAGIESVDLVLVFTSEDALAALLDDEIELGATVEVAAGPLGRAAELGTNVTFDAPIYSYSRSEGLFAGASLQGVVVRLDEEANTAVYGEGPMIMDVLLGKVEAPEAVHSFVEALPQKPAPSES